MHNPNRIQEEPREASARVLAIDLDDLTLERVRAAIRDTEFALSVVEPQEALVLARASDLPVVFVLEWAEAHGEDTVRFCEALRAASSPDRCYVLALGGVAEQSTLLDAMSGAADGVLRRPFGTEWLLANLRQAMQSMVARRGAAHHPRDELREALASPEGGDVVVRCGAIVGQIHVQRGHVVWAHLSSVPASMEEVARHGGVSLDPEVVASVKQECRATGAHFMEVLVKWGVVPEDRAREAVRAFVAGRVKLILELPGAVALFLPKARHHSERLRFRVSEIPSLHTPSPSSSSALRDAVGPPSSRSMPPLALAQMSSLLDEAMKVEGALGAAILERKTGTCLVHTGVGVDTDVAWSLVSALTRIGASAGEVMASAGERLFVVRPLARTPALVLFAALSASAISPGLARILLTRLAATGTVAPPSPAEAAQDTHGGEPGRSDAGLVTTQ